MFHPTHSGVVSMMRQYSVCSICLTAFTLGLLLSTPTPARAADPDKLAKAKEKLQQRMRTRVYEGYTKRTREEQELADLKVIRRRRQFEQHGIATSAAFKKAKGEAYMELAKHTLSAGTARVYSGYTTSLVEDYNTGTLTPVTTRSSYVVVDPLAAAIAVHWGEKAAKFKGFAAAQEYRANTYLASRIENADMRIRSLEAAIAQNNKLAKK